MARLHMAGYRICAVGVVFWLASGRPAKAGYFSFQGNFTSSSGAFQDIVFRTLPLLTSETTFVEVYTNASSGGPNYVGESIASGGIDSTVTLFTVPSSQIAFNDDKGDGSLDSRLGIDVPPGLYRLRLANFGTNIGDGHWNVDLANFNSMTVSSLPSSNSTLKSLTFGDIETSIMSLNWSSGTLAFTQSLQVNAGGVLKHSGGSISALSVVIAGGSFELSGGTLSVPTGSSIVVSSGSSSSIVDSSGGRFDWISGTVKLDSFTPDAAGALGSVPTLTPGQTLEVLGATTINTALTLNGGRLITDSLAGPGALVLSSGELQITGAAGMNVDAAGPLGANVAIKPGLFLNVPAGMTVTGGSSLAVQDGGRVSTNVLTNSPGGLLQFGGPTARLEGLYLYNEGVVSGQGILDQQLVNQSSGEVSVSAGQTLRLVNAAATHENAGLMRLAGGELLFAGALANTSDGRIEGRGVLRTGGLANAGHIALSSGITDVYGDVDNNTSAADTGVTVSGNADVTFWDDVNNEAGSLFRVSAGSSATFFGTLSGAGISGPGAVYLEADVTPGASPATAEFGGAVHFGPASRLVIELGGDLPGSFDQLHVSDQLSLDGVLEVTLIDDFTLAAGAAFDILDWGSLSGSFASIQLPALAGLAWDTSHLYTSGVLSVTPAFEADFDEDGDVDGDDLTEWRGGFGLSGAAGHTDGDADGDQDVDGADFLAWQRQLGSGGDALANTAVVPEPSTLLLAIMAAAGIRRRSGGLHQELVSVTQVIKRPLKPGTAG